MKNRFSGILVSGLCVLMLGYGMSAAFGRGGRGGGGGFGGRGGGISRPSGGGMSRPSGGGASRPSGGGISRPPVSASRPSGGVSRPSGGAPASRPSIGSSPSFNRPSGGSSRPRTGTGSGSRPSVQPGTRPNIGSGQGIGSRPSTLPANRPGIGSGQGIGSGAGIANRPGGTTNVGGNNRVNINTGNIGISQRPTTLPGLGASTGLANRGAGVSDRMANRPQTLEGRRSDLNDRMTSGREDWQQHRGDMQDDRQDWRSDNREDWQDFAHDNMHHHGGWYNGCWGSGAHWDYMWDNYPVAAAFGVTRWGVNRIAYGLGYWGYSNPYASSGGGGGSSYSEPLVVYSESAAVETVPADPATAPVESTTAGSPQPTDEGLAAFEEARASFYAGDYEKALTQLDTTLKTMPRDTVVHEFRGLVLFALKKYPESSAAVYAVLSAGPGWDWTSMSGLYPSVDAYTPQLRALENFAKANPKSPDASFLLGYHYQTMGHTESAGKFFAIALEQLPGDRLLTQLVDMTRPPGAKEKSPPPAPPAPADLPPEKLLTAEKLVGTWKASTADAKFELKLSTEGTFIWNFSRGRKTEPVKGVFAVDQNNLAMEPDAGGTMLAEIDLLDPLHMVFKMIGGEANDPGLQFTKN